MVPESRPVKGAPAMCPRRIGPVPNNKISGGFCHGRWWVGGVCGDRQSWTIQSRGRGRCSTAPVVGKTGAWVPTITVESDGKNT